MRRLALTALLCAQACRCGAPQVVVAAPECDGAHPCGAWKRCAFNTCLPDPRAPAAVVLAADQAVPSDGGPHLLHLAGTTEAGTTVRLFAQAGCAGDPVREVTAGELGRGVDLPFGESGALTPSALARSPGGVASACVSLPAVAATRTDAELLAALKAGSLDQVQQRYDQLRAAHERLLAQLPPALSAALPGRWVPAAGELVSLELNGDGRPDYAVPVLLRARAQGLESRLAGRALLEWSALDDGERPLLLALSQPGGGFAFEVRGSAPSTRLPLSEVLGCDRPGLARKVDLAWASAHACDALGYGAVEDVGPGQALLFDHRTGALVEVFNSCE